MKHTTRVRLHRQPAEKSEVLAAVPAPRTGSAGETDGGGEDQRWQARPRAAWLLRLAIFAVPLLGCIGCAWLVSGALPHPTDVWSEVLWWMAVIGASTVALLLLNRVARRLLPLTLLLRLSMVFPDQAPKRYRVAARAWSSRRLQEQISRQRVAAAQDTTGSLAAATNILALMANLAAHDRRTRGHCERVRAYNDLIADELGLSRDDRDRLRWAALIHDIGKLKVPPRLLNKPERPTPSEWEILRAHPIRGAEIAAPIAAWLGPWAAAIEQHHERWDGTGYPHGLVGIDISLGARIVAVADAFEVMTSLRPYGRPVNPQTARGELADCAGTQFDPLVVRAFLNVSLGRLRAAMGLLVLLSQLPAFARREQFSASLRALTTATVGAGVAVAVAIGPATAPQGHAAGLPLVASAPVPGPSSIVAAPPAVSGSTATPAAATHPAVRPATPPRHVALRRSTGRGSAGVVTLGQQRLSASAPASATKVRPPTQQHRPVRRPPATAPTPPPAGGVTTPPSTGGGATTPPPPVAGSGHGRCAGNAGAGVGNGGGKTPHRGRNGGPAGPSGHAGGVHACG